MSPRDISLRFGLNLEYPWERDGEMDTATKNMAKTGNLSALLKKSAGIGRKIGRNEPCPCGSGKKYKRCCLPG